MLIRPHCLHIAEESVAFCHKCGAAMVWRITEPFLAETAFVQREETDSSQSGKALSLWEWT